MQDVTRRSEQRVYAQASLKTALRWVNDAFVGEPDDVRTWPALVPLSPHLLSVGRYADAERINEPTGRLMNELGLLFKARAQYADAEPLRFSKRLMFQMIPTWLAVSTIWASC